jgi:hypothetical protein
MHCNNSNSLVYFFWCGSDAELKIESFLRLLTYDRPSSGSCSTLGASYLRCSPRGLRVRSRCSQEDEGLALECDSRSCPLGELCRGGLDIMIGEISGIGARFGATDTPGAKVGSAYSSPSDNSPSQSTSSSFLLSASTGSVTGGRNMSSLNVEPRRV